MMTKKILFVIPDMQQGGAEKVVSVMANHWSEQGHSVSILHFDNAPSYFSLNKNINLQSLHSANKSLWIFGFLVNNYSRTKNYFKQLRKIQPDIIISFTDNANVYCQLYKHVSKIPLILTQRTNPRFNTLPKIISWLPKRIYKKADAMVVQTRKTLEIYNELNIKLPERTRVIYNPLPGSSYFNGPQVDRKNIILAVGRLNIGHKHFDKLIDIFHSMSGHDWELHIAGEGPDRLVLEKKINELNLGNRVFLLGDVKELSSLYQQAKIFVLTSEFEGFPNALCEAMSNGCACISYDCPTGPSEMISSSENGILIEPGNMQAFGRALQSLVENEETILRFSSEAVKIKDKLNERKIMEEWEMLINDILQSEK